MSIKIKLPMALTALLFSASVAVAQAPAPGPAAPAAPKAAAPKVAAPKVGGRKKATTPEGIQCSAEADAKGLKGKERRKFRTSCINALKGKPSKRAKKG